MRIALILAGIALALVLVLNGAGDGSRHPRQSVAAALDMAQYRTAAEAQKAFDGLWPRGHDARALIEQLDRTFETVNVRPVTALIAKPGPLLALVTLSDFSAITTLFDKLEHRRYRLVSENGTWSVAILATKTRRNVRIEVRRYFDGHAFPVGSLPFWFEEFMTGDDARVALLRVAGDELTPDLLRELMESAGARRLHDESTDKGRSAGYRYREPGRQSIDAFLHAIGVSWIANGRFDKNGQLVELSVNRAQTGF